jgi:hypothetical protein
MNFAKTLVFGAVLATLGAIGSFGHTDTAQAASCDAHGIGDRTMTNSTNNSAYKINGNTATVTFDVVGDGCNNFPVTMIAWEAPNGTDGRPYSQQKMFAYKRGTFDKGRHSMSIELPQCYFQVDTVTGTSLVGEEGGAYHYNERQVAFMHGGTKACNQPIKVCDLSTYKVITIREDDFDAKKHSKDLTLCNPMQVCDLASKQIVSIPKGQYNETKYSTDLAKCAPVTPGMIQVCRLSDKAVVSIKETDFNEATYTKDLSQCQVTPAELPSTGPEAGILGMIGAGSMTGSAYYWLRSRRDLVASIFKR